jgi:hypothetical protein
LSGNLAFGTVEVGKTKEATLTIANTGNAVLTVSGLGITSTLTAAYTASWTTGTIGAGASQVVTIHFAPLAAQDYNGAITVTADHTSGANTIAVSGTGAAPLPQGPAAGLLLFGGPNGSSSVFVGCLSCSRFDSLSVCNRFGDFGSRFADKSIWNRFGDYGSRFSDTSPWNKFASFAPKIFDSAGNFYGYFTSNRFLTPRTTDAFFRSFLDNVDFVNEDLDAARDAFCE